MIARALFSSDLEAIDELWRKYHQDSYGLPPIDQTIFEQVVEHEGKIICAGVVHLIPEAIIVMDLEAELQHRIFAIGALLTNGCERLTELEYDQLHAFIQDEKFERYLRKRHGFNDVKGKALVKRLSNG
jgi:hypothetical protein